MKGSTHCEPYHRTPRFAGAWAVVLVASVFAAEAPPAVAPAAGAPGTTSAAAPAAAPSSAGHRPLGVEGAIPFANHRGAINDWQGDGEKGIWVQGIDRQWYYGKFMSDCIGLPWANGVEFRTEPSGEFNKFSSIVVRREHFGPCQLTSFVTSAGPPSAKARKAAAAAAAKQPGSTGATARGSAAPPAAGSR